MPGPEFQNKRGRDQSRNRLPRGSHDGSLVWLTEDDLIEEFTQRYPEVTPEVTPPTTELPQVDWPEVKKLLGLYYPKTTVLKTTSLRKALANLIKTYKFRDSFESLANNFPLPPKTSHMKLNVRNLPQKSKQYVLSIQVKRKKISVYDDDQPDGQFKSD